MMSRWANIRRRSGPKDYIKTSHSRKVNILATCRSGVSIRMDLACLCTQPHITKTLQCVAENLPVRNGILGRRNASSIGEDHMERHEDWPVYVVKQTGCWLWQGLRNKDGYGLFESSTGWEMAHRTVYTAAGKGLARGILLDHLCRHRACVNPDHLDPVDNKENVRRGKSPAAINALRTHCIHGHPFDEINTAYTKKGRRCRECNRISNRATRKKVAQLPASLDKTSPVAPPLRVSTLMAWRTC